MTSSIDTLLRKLNRQLSGNSKPGSRPGTLALLEFRVRAIHEPFVNKRIGRCLVLARIGQGAMSVVYKGKQDITDRLVAIKVLRSQLCSNPLNIKRFQREARAISKLSHPNLISVYDVGAVESTGQPYFVMDYLDGRCLADVIASEGPICWERVVCIFIQVADAMEHAHRNGIIHRDLKPDNIVLLDKAEFPDYVKVVDFGIVKLDDKSQMLSQRLTRTGEVWGSPIYMAPEQCLGQVLDARTDVYSLGITMYECLTGKSPFEGKQIAEIINKQINQDPIRPVNLRPELQIPSGLDAIVMKALQKIPSNRYQTMLEMRADLEKGLAAAQKTGRIASQNLAVSLLLSTGPVSAAKAAEELKSFQPEVAVNPAPAPQAVAEHVPSEETRNKVLKKASAGFHDDPHIGTRLADRYTIVSKIGEGGMSCVYRAKQDVVDRYVAVKMLHEELCEDEANVKRFQREAKALSKLVHPNLITIHDQGVAHTGQPYFVMELIEGQSLAELLAARGNLKAEMALPIFSQACDAVEYAHRNGIVHRDLKPDNIMLTKGPQNYVKLVDFGIVKALEGQVVSQRLTKTGEIWGSPVYMSPEQCMGEELDARSDIYSLGTVMYEVFTGQFVFESKQITEVIEKQVTDMPRPFKAVLGDGTFPAQVEAIVFKALQKDKKKRFQSMEEMKAAIDTQIKLLKESGTGGGPQLADRYNKGAVNWLPLVVVASIFGVIVLLGTLGFMLIQAMLRPAPPVPSVQETKSPVTAVPPAAQNKPPVVQRTPITESHSLPSTETAVPDQKKHGVFLMPTPTSKSAYEKPAAMDLHKVRQKSVSKFGISRKRELQLDVADPAVLQKLRNKHHHRDDYGYYDQDIANPPQ